MSVFTNWFKSRQKLVAQVVQAEADRDASVANLEAQRLSMLLTGIENDAYKRIGSFPMILQAPTMLALLEELVDIEGQQPGNAAWFFRVVDVISKARRGAA